MPLPAKHIGFSVFLAFFLAFSAHAQVCHTYGPGEYIHERSFKTEDADSVGLATTGNYDIIYHRISVIVDPAIRYIQGSVTSYFRPVTALSQISFDLTDSLTVDSVYYAGSRLLSFSHSSSAVTVSFPATISSLDSVVVYYQGIPPRTGFGSFAVERHDSIVPVLWTLSEPYGARDWFPCKMTLIDKVDSLDFYINVPSGNRAASNGLLIDSTAIGSTVTYHWRHRYPIATYLIAMGVTNYTAHSFIVPTQYGPVTVLDYAYPESESEWEATDTPVMRTMQLYSDMFGPYPFIKEKYGHAQFGWSGGMEHQTMSFMYNLGFELVNHEMAHQWFGDKLTCNSWSEIWLNEGFATFLTGLCYERIAPEYWLAWRQSVLGKILKEGEDGTLLCDDTTSVPRIFSNSLSYSKGAYLLHMLRLQLGDKDLFAALRDYVNDPALAYSFSKTVLLKAHLEQQSGQDLSVFFQQWFYNRGYPSYSLDWSQQGTRLSLKLNQSSNNPATRFFTMPVPVKFVGSGTDTTLILDHRSSGQTYVFDIPFPIDSVVIDPELWLISTQNTVRRLPAPEKENFIVLMNNPVRNDLTIWYDSKSDNHVMLSIYDLAGHIILAQEIPAGNGDYYTTSLAHLPSAVYIAKIITEKNSLTQRIVKF